MIGNKSLVNITRNIEQLLVTFMFAFIDENVIR